MKYPDLCVSIPPELKGIGDEPNEIVARKARVCFVSRHKKYKKSQQDEHDRFMPMWFNNMRMPVNIRD